MKLTIWAKLDAFPPIACRLLARKQVDTGGVVAKTAEEIAEDSGLTVFDVNSLSWLTSWDSVPVSKARSFMEGCGIYLDSRESVRSHRAYMKRDPSYKYLRKSTQWNEFYKPLIIQYARHTQRLAR